MKAKLIFNLSDPDERVEFERINKSLSMACALFDILQLRKATERRFENIDNANNDVFDGIDAMAKGISEALENHNINIDEII